MPFTSFTRDDDMRANELIHHVELPVSNAFASLVVAELGEPSFRRKDVCAWYTRAHLQSSAGSTQPSVPFSLRWDHNGNAVVIVSFERLEELAVCFQHIVTGLEIVELPRGRNNRAA